MEMRSLFILVALVLFANTAPAMTADGCGAGSCADCHSITKEETAQLLGSMVDKVTAWSFRKYPVCGWQTWKRVRKSFLSILIFPKNI